MRLYRAALGGLAVVLLLLAGFGIGSARRTDRAAHRASSATELSNAYEEARFAVGEEESLERKYRLEPGPEVRAKHRQASRDLGAALVDIGRIGTPADRALVTRLLAVHRTYLRAIDRLFLAVDRHEVKRVLAIDGRQVDPLFGLIVDRVDDASRAHREVTARSLRDLRGTERSALTATPVVFALGLLLLAFFTVLVARINRRLARQARESDHNARHDAMTGLPNRAELGRQVGRAIAAAADDPAPFSVQMIDLDRFKEINDTLGHTTGDRLLREIASRLQPFVGPADTLARVGGDEFGLLSASAGADDAQAMAGRIAAALREPFAVDELSLTIDVSIGIVTYPAHGEDAETLLRRAGIAGHMAKGSDRAAALYDPTADHYDPERLRLAGELRRAIDEDELELHYQPKFAISGLRVSAAQSARSRAHARRRRSGAGGRSSARSPAPSPATARSTRWCARWRT
jgi:diguanylate cyclase (GGDEF)-like protein